MFFTVISKGMHSGHGRGVLQRVRVVQYAHSVTDIVPLHNLNDNEGKEFMLVPAEFKVLNKTLGGVLNLLIKTTLGDDTKPGRNCMIRDSYALFRLCME